MAPGECRQTPGPIASSTLNARMVYIEWRMIQIAHTGDRLTIEDGNVIASVVGALALIAIAGAGLISCSLVTDNINSEIYRQAGISQTPWGTIASGAITLLLVLVAPLQWHNRIVFDRAQGTLRWARVTLFGISVRRELALASIRGAKVAGSRGAFWQLEIELDSGEAWTPPSSSMYAREYQPDQLQRIADQVNQFLGVAKMEARQGGGKEARQCPDRAENTAE